MSILHRSSAPRLGAGLAVAAILGACGPSPRASSDPVAPAAVSSSNAPRAGTTPQAVAGEAQQHVADALEQVAKVRHLAARAQVTARVLDRSALIAAVREHVDREVPRDVIRNQGEVLIGLGLVTPDFDYEEGAFRLLEAQLAGFYEPHDKKMYLASDLDPRARDATLAHELVHALQDQHYDLGQSLSYKEQANDKESALQALAEGDATSAMMDLLLAPAQRSALDISDDVFAAEVEGSMESGGEGANAPRVLRSSLVAPYVDGVLFVNALRRRGLAAGNTDGGWGAVDGAWRSPPTTTEQLLHLAKYDAHEPAEELALPRAPPGDRWEAVYDDVFGEEGFRIAVEQWLSPKIAAAAATGWGGDRAVLFRARGNATQTSFAMAWHVRFDVAPGKAKDAEAVEAFRALAASLRPSDAASPKPICVERSGMGPLVILRSGQDLVFATGPYRREETRVSTDSDCPHTARWAADVVGKRKP